MNLGKTFALALGLLAGSVPLNVYANEPTAAQLEFFENKIRPVLVNRCYKCHSTESQKLKGDLSVQFREALLLGGSSGPAIVPGKPEESLLIAAIRGDDPDLVMPPKGERLSTSEVNDFVAWIKMGAPDPRKSDTGSQAGWGVTAKDHWAFQPIQKTGGAPGERQGVVAESGGCIHLR